MTSPATAGIGKADFILVLKERRVLKLLRHGVVLKSYPIALGPHPIGAKHEQGDGKTPEGIYFVEGHLSDTPYNLALRVSYPNKTDRIRAERTHLEPGDNIWIHGLPVQFTGADPIRFYNDWTKGCIAVGNAAIAEIWHAVDDGTPIEIRP